MSILYQPHFIPTCVWLIGGGGTGSRLMPMMAQLVKSCLNEHNPQGHLLACPIYVVDGDIVEDKNLIRQNFIQPDVGRNKAIVLAERYSQAFDLPIFASPHFLGRDLRQRVQFDNLPEDVDPSFEGSVVILGVDSARARRDILRYIFESPNSGLTESGNMLVIDAGNEDAFGQVTCWTPHAFVGVDSRGPATSAIVNRMPELYFHEERLPFIPMDLAHYANLGESTQELSCEALPQTLCVNSLAAINILRIMQNFFLVKPWPFKTLRFHMGGGDSTEMLSPQLLKEYVRKGYSTYSYLGDRGEAEYANGVSSWYRNRRIRDINGRSFAADLHKRAEAKYAEMGLKLGPNGEMITPPPAAPAPAPALPAADIPPLVETPAPKMPRSRTRPATAEVPPSPPPLVEVRLDAQPADDGPEDEDDQD